MAGNMLLHCLSTGKDIGSLICNVGASAAAAAAAPAAGGAAAGGDSKPEEKEEAKKEESEESSDEDMGFGMCIFILLQRFLVHNLSELFSLCRSLWLKRTHNCYQAPHALMRVSLFLLFCHFSIYSLVQIFWEVLVFCSYPRIC